MNQDAIVPDGHHYWDIIESSEPEIWPGSIPWRDAWGSFGTIPNAAGYGAAVQRTRVPREDLERFWTAITQRYSGDLPRFSVGPRETPGLDRWLQSHGYHREMVQTLLVLRREAFHHVGPAPHGVEEVADLDDLIQVLALDHLVFGDPLPGPDGMAEELARLGSCRRLVFIRGDEGIAQAAGGLTHFGDWSLLWGGETHPAFRRHGLYHAVLAARMDIIKQTSAAFTAVYANNETSLPILRQIGFRPIGTIEVWKPAGERSGLPI